MLSQYPPEAVIVQASDAEGNSFHFPSGPSLGRLYSEDDPEFMLDALTPDLEDQGYTEADVGEGPLAVCLWP